MSSMNRISSTYQIPQTRAEQASGIAIDQEMTAQISGYDQGVRNGEDGQSMLQTADGALSSISDRLQRIRELSVQASSTAIYSDTDRAMMQQEVDQLKQSISDVAKYTQFNTLNLLDGSMADMHLATNPSGGGMDIKMTNVTLEALGIQDYDLTGDFDIQTIDDALEKVTSARNSLGAQSSALAYTISSSQTASYYLTASQANIEDIDIPKMVEENKKKEILQNYQYFLQNQQRKLAENNVNRLFM